MFFRKVPMPAAMEPSPGGVSGWLAKGMPKGSLTRQVGVEI
jgi:hypothetical protein